MKKQKEIKKLNEKLSEPNIWDDSKNAEKLTKKMRE